MPDRIQTLIKDNVMMVMLFFKNYWNEGKNVIRQGP